MRSRDVLEDCKQALADFQAATNPVQWRIRWVTLIALLRCVGHVLKNIDRNQSAEWKEAVDEAWKRCNDTKPDPKILWEFIEAERNNVLKAYDVGAELDIRRSGAIMGFTPSIAAHQKNYDLTIESFMRSGPFSGDDAIEVCRQAIAFWEQYLDEVEAAATKAP